MRLDHHLTIRLAGPILLILIFGLTGPGLAQVPDGPRLPPDRNKHALIISGISGEEGYARQFTDWKDRLRRALVERLGFAADQVRVLTESPGADEGRSTAEVITRTFGELAGKAGRGQPVFIFLIGHGSFDGEVSRINLPGPDLPGTALAEMLRGLPTDRLVVVNMTSASGEYIKLLSGVGRVVITATRSGMEQNAPKFAEHFIAALEKEVADLDRNRRLSVLEAYEYGVKLTTEQYERSGRLVTEHPLLDDNGDGVGHPRAEAGDGGLARITYLDSLPQQQAGGDPELARLYEERLRLEGAIEQLKGSKAGLRAEEYATALERLLIEMARLNRTIRTRPKR